MNCPSAKATITRYLQGERSRLVLAMIEAAEQHTIGCDEAGCVRTQMRLDQTARQTTSSHAPEGAR